MSEFFTGITFPQQKVTPSDDAAVRRAALADGILSGCALSYAGSTLTMGDGSLLCCGRQFRHTTVQNWAVTGATSGYARLVLAVDTTRASTKDAFDQIVDTIEYASSLDGFLQLQQDDINEAGTIYQIAVCVVSLGAGGITGIVEQIGKTVSCSKVTTTATLEAGWWSDSAPYVQGVVIPGIIESDMPHIAPVYSTTNAIAIAQKEAWACVSKAVTEAGLITFTCFEDKPTTAIPIQIEVIR